jgi:tRNA nucleotidyltransferase (CCA-adding enzyme)
MGWFLARAGLLGVLPAAPYPLLRGRHLLDIGVAPGPRVGAILSLVYARQLDGRITSVAEGIAAARLMLSEPAEAVPPPSPSTSGRAE